MSREAVVAAFIRAGYSPTEADVAIRAARGTLPDERLLQRVERELEAHRAQFGGKGECWIDRDVPPLLATARAAADLEAAVLARCAAELRDLLIAGDRWTVTLHRAHQLVDRWAGTAPPLDLHQLLADLAVVLHQQQLHSHYRPGIWDYDHKTLAGQPCTECAARARLQDLVDARTDPPATSLGGRP